MIHKKLFSYSIYAIAAAIFIYSLLYLYINYVYVPKKIAPMVYAYVNSDPFKPLEVSVSEVAFHPFRGFVLRDLLVESPTV